MKYFFLCFTAVFVTIAPLGCDDAGDGTPASSPENSVDLCQDDEDNDGDGAVDCEDAECLGLAPCVSTDTEQEADLDQFVESPGEHCTVPNTDWDNGAWNALPEIPKLPDPFTMIDGTPVSTRSQWVCRRAEISALLQKWELGDKPAKPDSVTGEISGTSFTVHVSDGGSRELSFSVSITYPTSGSGPFPALIGLAGGSLPRNSFLDRGVAIINYDHDSMGNQNGQRGVGQFFDFNGDVDAGALLAWSWGASRLIDALEVTAEANIDPTRLAVNGCSRNGKGALMIGALDNRFALTIPQESGSGGVASWRVSEDDDAGEGRIQTLSSAAGEQPWFRENFIQFGPYVDTVPIDHHQVLGMVAPRGLLVIGNVGWEWLGENSGDQSAAAARLIYEALGARENMAHTESGHNHCDFPAIEVPVLEAFIDKFLLDKDVDTDSWTVSYSFEREKWVDWEVPDLR